MRRAALMLLTACATASSVETAAPPPSRASTETVLSCPASRPAVEGAPEEVAGRPVAKVCLVGGDAALREVVDALEGRPLEVERVREAIVALFATGTVRDADAIATSEGDELVLTFFVTPYEAVGKVRIEGAQAFPGVVVLREVDPAEYAWASPVSLGRLRDTVKDFYDEHGYPGAQVLVTVEGSEVVVTVQEGALEEVKRISFSGVKKVKEAVLRALLSSREGGAYSARGAAHDEEALTLGYYDRGLIQAEVKAAFEQGELGFTVKEGEVFKLGKLSLAGVALSGGERVLATLESKPGAAFSRATVQRDLKRLEAHAASEGLRVTVTPVSTIDATKKTVAITFELERRE